jgi:hypothetical protein
VKDWKACELRIAELLGGYRVLVTGRSRGDVPDGEHPKLTVEVKRRKRLPNWLEDAPRQAEASPKRAQLPVAVLHQYCRPYPESLVVVRLKGSHMLCFRAQDP